MAESISAKMSFIKIGSAWAGLLVLLIGFLNVQQGKAQSKEAEQKPSFDVASVKPAEQCGQSFSPSPGARIFIGSSPKYQPGRYTACGSLISLIWDVYKIESSQVTGGPDWIGKALFQIEARAEESTGQDQMRLMVQTLLEDRFKLKFHRESRETSVYSLVVAKGGHKLKEAKDENGNPIVSLPPPPDKPPSPEEMAKMMQSGPKGKAGPGSFTMMMGPNGSELRASATTMSRFADSLRNTVSRKVVDKTGLNGFFDVELHYAQDTQLGSDRIVMPGSDTSVPVSNSGPSIYTALQEQLGLKLEPEKVPLEYIVIDSVEKPSEN
jgi:uncharacterized protein (TIGR03435 family)